MKKATLWILGAVAVVGGVLFVMWKRGIGAKPATPPASASVVPAPNPATSHTTQELTAAAGLVGAIAGGLGSLGVSFK